MFNMLPDYTPTVGKRMPMETSNIVQNPIIGQSDIFVKRLGISWQSLRTVSQVRIDRGSSSDYNDAERSSKKRALLNWAILLSRVSVTSNFVQARRRIRLQPVEGLSSSI